MHGLFTERGKGNLNDFLVGKVERKFLNDDLKLELLGAVEAKDLDDIEDNYGTVLVPEISYRPVDNIELALGAYFFAGKSGTLFGRLEEQDQIYLEVQLSF